MRQSIWCFLMKLCSWRAKLIEFPESINNVLTIVLVRNELVESTSISLCLVNHPLLGVVSMVPVHRLFWTVVRKNWYFVQNKKEKRPYYCIFWKQRKTTYWIINKQIIWLVNQAIWHFSKIMWSNALNDINVCYCHNWKFNCVKTKLHFWHKWFLEEIQ